MEAEGVVIATFGLFVLLPCTVALACFGAVVGLMRSTSLGFARWLAVFLTSSFIGLAVAVNVTIGCCGLGEIIREPLDITLGNGAGWITFIGLAFCGPVVGGLVSRAVSRSHGDDQHSYADGVLN